MMNIVYFDELVVCHENEKRAWDFFYHHKNSMSCLRCGWLNKLYNIIMLLSIIKS